MILNIIFIINVIVSIYFIHKNKQSITVLKVDNNAKNSEIVRLKNALSACEGINVEEQKIRTNLNKKYDSLQKDYNKIYDDKASLETTVDNYATQVTSLNKSIKEKEYKIAEYKAEIDVREGWKTTANDYKLDIEGKDKEIHLLNVRISTLENTISNAKIQQGSDIIESVSTKKTIRKRK